MDAEELQARTKRFALRIIKLVRAMPRTIEARAIANQLVRSGTAIGANYRASCRSRSRAEFAARIGVTLEEADETCYWLELIIESDMLKPARVQPLLQEAKELTAIFARSAITSRK